MEWIVTTRILLKDGNGAWTTLLPSLKHSDACIINSHFQLSEIKTPVQRWFDCWLLSLLLPLVGADDCRCLMVDGTRSKILWTFMWSTLKVQRESKVIWSDLVWCWWNLKNDNHFSRPVFASVLHLVFSMKNAVWSGHRRRSVHFRSYRITLDHRP